MTYRHILVPLDGSQLAEYILPHVHSMASAYNAQVTLFHVVEADKVDPQRLTPSLEKARANIVKYLEQTSEALERKQVQCQWRLTFGDPALEIIRHASTSGADLVMMATHGRGEHRHGGLGSVGSAVVSGGSTPVMLVRPPDEVAAR